MAANIFDLRRRQAALQREADEVLGDLELVQLLAAVGHPVRTGASALGLMVQRDIDVTVICDTLEIAPVTVIASALASHPRIHRVLFRNDTHAWNTDPRYPDGLYLGPVYRSLGGDWTLDIWFVDEPERQPDLEHLRTSETLLTEASRDAILAIKSEWVERAEYGKTVSSYDIYRAVLEDGVRSSEQFAAWLTRRA
ncbi:MAG: hypothetical protein WAL04_15710 [Acidimicrobiales bacterium]|jgi:hypothetical protein